MAGLARAAMRFRYVVIAGWLIAGALCVLLLPSLGSSVNTDNSTFLLGSCHNRTEHAALSWRARRSSPRARRPARWW